MSDRRVSRGRGRAASLLSIAVLLAACGERSGASPTTNSTQAPPPTAAVTVAPTIAATATVEATPIVNGALCVIEKQQSCRMPVGNYTTAPFEHPFTFTIAEVWMNTRASEHGGGMVTTGGEDSFNWATSIEGGFVGLQDEVEIGPKPQDFLDFVQSGADEPGFTVSEPTDVEIGGLSGRQIDLAKTETSVPFGFTIAEDSYFVEHGGKDRFIVFEVEGATVLLILESSESSAFDGHAARVQPILDSIVWQ